MHFFPQYPAFEYKMNQTILIQTYLSYISIANHSHCLKEAKQIFQADSHKEALRRFKSWKAKWLVEEERAVACMRKDLFSCLHYHDFDKELWKSIRTTNILERTFREMRRRTRPMNNFFTK
jgi:putative transposase